MRSKQNPRSKKARRARQFRTMICLACACVILAGALYTAAWIQNRNRIEKEAQLYQQMYAPASDEATSPPSIPPATPSAGPVSTPDVLPEVNDLPIPTPDADTQILTLPSAPPVQDSFDELLAYNPDTVGYLQIDDFVSLPVVQRENDNEYYLTHNFSGTESPEGALFLDGLNRLVPEDDCLIVYGHNMQNGTMFGDLKLYLDLSYFRSCPLVHFDTLYENRLYAPFAAFSASVDPGDASYFDVRQFIFDPDSFDHFVLSLRSRSYCDVPLDVQYGDRLLLLVTCDSSHADGRMILALRALRDGENAEDTAALIAQAG